MPTAVVSQRERKALVSDGPSPWQVQEKKGAFLGCSIQLVAVSAGKFARSLKWGGSCAVSVGCALACRSIVNAVNTKDPICPDELLGMMCELAGGCVLMMTGGFLIRFGKYQQESFTIARASENQDGTYKYIETGKKVARGRWL